MVTKETLTELKAHIRAMLEAQPDCRSIAVDADDDFLVTLDDWKYFVVFDQDDPTFVKILCSFPIPMTHVRHGFAVLDAVLNRVNSHCKGVKMCRKQAADRDGDILIHACVDLLVASPEALDSMCLQRAVRMMGFGMVVLGQQLVKGSQIPKITSETAAIH